MLQINADQMQQFRNAAALRFESAMVAHARGFAPQLYAVIGPDQMRVAIAGALGRARAHGLTFCGPLRLYVEMTLLYGSGFDDDPQYPALREILQAPRDQMVRARQIFDHIAVFQTRVAGPDARNVFDALGLLSQIARAPDRYELAQLDRQLLHQMNLAFAAKAAYVGNMNLARLIAEGRAEARQHGFETARAQALIPILMYAFGHRCTRDPLYPWIGRTLADPRIVDAPSRAQRLERKALTWLDHVLAAQARS